MSGTPQPDISEAGKFIRIVIPLCAISSLTVSLRIWVRLRMTKQWIGADDIFMIVAAILNIAETALMSITTKYGLGRHIQYLQLPELIIFFKYAYAVGLVYLSLIVAIKTSLILFYMRLFPSISSPRFHAWCWGYICLNTTIWVTFNIAGIFSCSPIAYFWDRSIPGGKCINLGILYLINAVLCVLTDIAALLLPIQTVWNLNMKRKRKVQFIGLFSIGFFVCITSIIRMTTLLGYGAQTDPTFTMAQCNIWSMVEINVGIITVCTPVIKIFFTRYLWPIISGHTYKSSTSGSSGRGHKDQSHPRTFGSSEQSGSKSSSKRQHFRGGIYKGEDFMVTVDNEMDHYGGHTAKAEAGSAENFNDGRNSTSTSTRELQTVRSEQ